MTSEPDPRIERIAAFIPQDLQYIRECWDANRYREPVADYDRMLCALEGIRDVLDGGWASTAWEEFAPVLEAALAYGAPDTASRFGLAAALRRGLELLEEGS